MKTKWVDKNNNGYLAFGQVVFAFYPLSAVLDSDRCCG